MRSVIRGALLMSLVALGHGGLASCVPSATPSPDRARSTVRAQLTSPPSRVGLGEWTVTHGELVAGQTLSTRVEVPTMRAVLARATPPTAALRFVYLGPSRVERALASGALRRQIGLKLFAVDGCNLLYVMWRIAPESRLSVALKRNPGQRTHDECGVEGYEEVEAHQAAPLPPIAVHEEHVLAYSLVGRTLHVRADGNEVFVGELPEGFDRQAPLGMRSDNGVFELDVVVGDQTDVSRHGGTAARRGGPPDLRRSE